MGYQIIGANESQGWYPYGYGLRNRQAQPGP
jgi:hypothetical protein